MRLDSTILLEYLNTDLSNILSQYSTVFVKSYGNGSLSTPSFRGTTANHTQVEWNGININSPMLGQMDLSQVPVSQFQSLEILYGAATVARTSGAFGGIINLVSNPDWNNHINILVAQTVASFSNYTTDACLAMGNKNIQSITRFNYSNAKNDFPFNADTGKTVARIRQKDAEYVLGGLTQEVFIKLSQKDRLSARIWYNEENHHLPVTISTLASSQKEEERDRSVRSMIEYSRATAKYYLTVRSSLVDQYMKYTLDSSATNHRYYSWYNRARMVFTGIRNLSIKPGLDFNSDWVISDEYKKQENRKLVGLFSEFSYDLKKLFQFTFVFRQEMIDGKLLPFIPSVGIEYKPFRKENLTFSVNGCRNYRYPTLNDLYYGIYGNPDLKTETDYSGEGGVVYNFNTHANHFFIETELTGYYSKIINFIQWLPQPPASIWRPVNVNEVHARGVEAGLNLKLKIARLNISLNNNYNYCRSTSEKATSPNDASVGKQLIYIPIHTFNSTISLKIIGFYGSYIFTFVSDRFTSTDNLSYMQGYYLSNIILGKNFHLRDFILSLQLQINNLFDLDYQSIVDRPMPGRNYALTLKFNFRK